ncbi:heme A synthase [Planosporangium flavigriseum]|nr:COX15/CtaA family protein [Planosporangium flavigriseum]NJC65334.1 heme A synthase [Planosporangium flavigriseum]
MVLRRLALASLLANIGLVGTGGAVRLTGSGLGCPTWPRCTADSYTTTREMGVHGMIEFGNRSLTFVVALLALACVVSALCQRPRSRPLTLWSALVLAQIPAQAVIGGITVLTNLNPWVVGLHFLASMVVIAAAYQLWVRTAGAPSGAALARPLRTLTRLTVIVAAAVLAVGTVVTGSGPHAGDAGARRTGLDPQEISQLHTDLVFLLLGLSVALWYALRAAGAPARARRAAEWLIAVELAQGVIGFVQYFTHLPALAVGLHMIGAAAVWVATLAVLETTRPGAAVAPPPAPQAAPAHQPAPASEALPPTLARPHA